MFCTTQCLLNSHNMFHTNWCYQFWQNFVLYLERACGEFMQKAGNWGIMEKMQIWLLPSCLIIRENIVGKYFAISCKFNLLFSDQFGFLSKKSTSDAILKFTDKCYSNFNDKNVLISVFIDLSKRWGGHAIVWKLPRCEWILKCYQKDVIKIKYWNLFHLN